jgi:hypothetical protein
MTTEATTTDALARWETPDLDPKTLGQESWDGWLTLDNLDNVAARIQRMLTGQRFTFVAVNELFGDRPEVRTGNRLREPVRAYRHDGWGGLSWSDSRYVTGLHTSVQTQEQAREMARTDAGRKRLTSVSFEPSFRDRGTLLTEQWTGAGSRLYWAFVVEHSDVAE